jgi:hypothetical protein
MAADLRVRIPMCPRGDRAKALRACLEHAARNTDLPMSVVARTMSYFLEMLAEQVANGKVVMIPCFGMFAAKATSPKRKYRKTYPAFCGSAHFSRMVYDGVSVAHAPGMAIRRARQRNGALCCRKGKVSNANVMAVSAAMEFFRQGINHESV